MQLVTNRPYSIMFSSFLRNHRDDQKQEKSWTYAEEFWCTGKLGKWVAHDVPPGQMQSLGIMISQSLNMEHGEYSNQGKYSVFRTTLKFWQPSTLPLFALIWNTQLRHVNKNHILSLERVQRRATKLVRQFKNLSYDIRISETKPNATE